MIIILAEKDDITALAVQNELKRRNCENYILDTGNFPDDIDISYEISSKNSFNGRIIIEDSEIDLEVIKSIWCRRTRERKLIEDQYPTENKDFILHETEAALIGMFRCLGFGNCFWVSNPINMWNAENKPYQLRLASQVGFLIPNTLITNEIDKAKRFLESHPLGVITKLLDNISNIIKDKNGNYYGIPTGLLDKNKFNKYCYVIETVPYFFQQYAIKGVDLRITVVGNRIFAAEIHSQEVDWRVSDYRKIRHKKHVLPKSISELCLELVSKLGLVFGAIDMVLTPQNEYYFLEINPAGQWLWIEEMTGMPITAAIADLLVKGEGR